MKCTVSTKYQKFQVTEYKGTWKVRVTDKDTNKVWDFECKNYNETGNVIWNMANNNKVADDVCHKMCTKFRRLYWDD